MNKSPLLSMPNEIIDKIKNEALVPESNAPKYYVDLTYRNPDITSPAKTKDTLSNIRFLNPIDNPFGNALEQVYHSVGNLNIFTGELGQNAELLNQRQRFRDNANILRAEHNLTNAWNAVRNERVARMFNETFGGDLYDAMSWDTVYNKVVKPTRIDYPPTARIQYSTPLTEKSANVIKGAIRRRLAN